MSDDEDIEPNRCVRAGCGHHLIQHSGPGQACNAMIMPGERCKCNHAIERGTLAAMFEGARRTGDCFNIDGDPEQLCIFVRLALRNYAFKSLERTDTSFRRLRELMAELMLNDHVDERERLKLLFEYCRDIGPDVDMFKGPNPYMWGLGDSAD